LLIAGVAASVFEPKKLPEVGKNIGKIVKSFQQVGGSFWLPFDIQVKDRKL
jgi:sec-independent protein translocase protein TatA